MRVLEGFCRLVVGLDVEDRVSVSMKVISFSEISAVNLTEGWNWLACSMNKLMSCLLLFHREKKSSM